MFLMWRSGRDFACVTWPEGVPVRATNQCQMSVQDEQTGVEAVGVAVAVDIRLDASFADLIAQLANFGLEFLLVHGALPHRLGPYASILQNVKSDWGGAEWEAPACASSALEGVA